MIETIRNTGKAPMHTAVRSLIQFACSPGEEANDNLLIKYLLRHLDRPNTSVGKIFQDIKDDISRRRYNSKKPFLANRLPDDGLMCLNRVETEVGMSDDLRTLNRSRPSGLQIERSSISKRPRR